MSALPEPLAPADAPQAAAVKASGVPGRVAWWTLAALTALALLVSLALWQKLSRIQEQLARQTTEAGQQSLEAKAWAKQAQETVQDNAARTALLEARLAEVALQRGQLEELMQSLSRSRDENLVVDIDAALRMAQQQAQLTGSSEPLLAALKSAQQRVQRAAQPRLAPLARALEKDLERLRALPPLDLPGLLIRLDEGVALIDALPLANQQASGALAPAPEPTRSAPGAVSWWVGGLREVGEQLMGLFRVSRIDTPEAVLLSPEQGFFLRENLKLKLLNARLGLLARQQDAVRTDLQALIQAVRRYASPDARKTQQLLNLLEQCQQQVRSIELPRLEASTTALATLATGR